MGPERLREPPDKHLNCADDFDSMVESEHSDCSTGHVSDPTTHRLINSLSRDELIDSNREISRRIGLPVPLQGSLHHTTHHPYNLY